MSKYSLLNFDMTEICHWLQENDYAEAAEKLLQNRVNGAQLVQMSKGKSSQLKSIIGKPDAKHVKSLIEKTCKADENANLTETEVAMRMRANKTRNAVTGYSQMSKDSGCVEPEDDTDDFTDEESEEDEESGEDYEQPVDYEAPADQTGERLKPSRRPPPPVPTDSASTASSVPPTSPPSSSSAPPPLPPRDVPPSTYITAASSGPGTPQPAVYPPAQNVLNLRKGSLPAIPVMNRPQQVDSQRSKDDSDEVYEIPEENIQQQSSGPKHSAPSALAASLPQPVASRESTGDFDDVYELPEGDIDLKLEPSGPHKKVQPRSSLPLPELPSEVNDSYETASPSHIVPSPIAPPQLPSRDKRSSVAENEEADQESYELVGEALRERKEPVIRRPPGSQPQTHVRSVVGGVPLPRPPIGPDVRTHAPLRSPSASQAKQSRPADSGSGKKHDIDTLKLTDVKKSLRPTAVDAFRAKPGEEPKPSPFAEVKLKKTLRNRDGPAAQDSDRSTGDDDSFVDPTRPAPAPPSANSRFTHPSGTDRPLPKPPNDRPLPEPPSDSRNLPSPKEERALPSTPTIKRPLPPPPAEESTQAKGDRPLPPVPSPAAPSAGAQTSLDNYEWYDKHIARSEVESKMKAFNKNGAFLVRPSETPGQKGTLHIFRVGNPKIYRIHIRQRGGDGLYALGSEKPGEKTFETIPKLIEHYQENPVPVTGDSNLRLTVPVPK